MCLRRAKDFGVLTGNNRNEFISERVLQKPVFNVMQTITDTLQITVICPKKHQLAGFSGIFGSRFVPSLLDNFVKTLEHTAE